MSSRQPRLALSVVVWWARKDKNLQPIGYMRTALTTELEA